MFRNNWYRDVQAEMSKKPDTEIPWERPDFKGGRVPEQQLKPVELFLIEDKREIQRALALGASEFVSKSSDLYEFGESVCGMVRKWAA